MRTHFLLFTVPSLVGGLRELSGTSCRRAQIPFVRALLT